MSGYKRATVTIGEEEYRRLHEADMKRRFSGRAQRKEKDLAQVVDLTHALRQMENRQQQLEQAFGDLDQNSSQVNEDTVQYILTQNALCYQSLTAAIEEATYNTNNSLVGLSQLFAERMQQEREQYQRNLNTLVQRLDGYEQREQWKEQAARQWLRRSVTVADFIQGQFDHERFLPGRLSRVLRSLELAQSNLASGLPEACLQISQQAFLELSDLHFELEQRVVEWQTEYERTFSSINQSIADLELNAEVNALGLQGEELAEGVDLAYWTNGKYRQLVAKTREFLLLLEKDRPQISAEDLRHISTELPSRVAQSLESLIYEARLNALNSQLRMNIAERALQALEVHGFKLNQSGYINKDMRAAFKANLENSDGSQVMIEVLPSEKTNQELANELVVITNHPYLKTEHEARLQWQELCNSLNQFDLQVSRPEVRSLPPGIARHVEQRPQLGEPLARSKRQHNVR